MNIISSGIILTTLLHLTAVVELLIIRRHYHDGVLYEDYAADSDSVRYTNTKGEGWNNLDSLVVEHQLRKKAMFCTRGPGAWLLYQDADYQYGTQRQIKLVYGEHCVAVDNINSIQPLGAVYAKIDDYSAVIAFSEKYFASKGETTRGSIKDKIKSVIFVGIGNWTVEFDEKKICVTISTAGDVCLMEDILNSFSTTSESLSISKGCGSGSNETMDGVEAMEAMEQYQLQTCYSKGFHELTYDFDFSQTSIQGMCSGGEYDPEDQTKNKFLQVIKLWKKRMNPPPATEPIQSTVINAVQRLRTLDTMVLIMGKTCSGVSPSFLEIVKQIYRMHVKNGDLWNVTVTPDGNRIETSHAKWSRAQSSVADCFTYYNAEVETGCHPQDISEMKNEKEVKTIEDFLNGESYDFVIEHVWLLLNYVSTYCNYHMGYKNNDWSIFPLLFKRDFLYPLQDQWKNPGKWSTYYPLMFNGFNMEDERKAVISCVQGVIKRTPFYDPLARPPSFYFPVNSTQEKDSIGGVTVTPEDTRSKRQKINLDTDSEFLSDESMPLIEGRTIEESKPKSTKSTTTTTTTASPKTLTTKQHVEQTIKPTIITTRTTTTVEPTTRATTTVETTTSDMDGIDSEDEEAPPVTEIITVGENTTETLETAAVTEKVHKRRRKGKGKHGKKHKGGHHKLLRENNAEMQLESPPAEVNQTVNKTA